MNTAKYQAGLSSIGWLLLLSTIGFFMLLTFKLAPLYITNMGIRSAMASMARGNPLLNQMDNREIRNQLSNYLTINSVRGHHPREFVIVRKKDQTLINYEYEVRVHMLHNVEAVVSFKNQIDSNNIEGCCKYLIHNESKKKENTQR